MEAIQFLLGGGAEQLPETNPDSLQAFRETSTAEQGLLLPAAAARVLKVTHQCVLILIQRKRLRTWEFFGKTYVSAFEVAERQRLKPKAGRPRGKVPELQEA